MRVEDYTRRGFLRDSVVAAAGASFGLSALAAAVPVTGVRAIAFDAFPIFDLRAITVTARQLFPEKGEMLASVWSTKLFESTWLETSAGRYVGFEALAARVSIAPQRPQTAEILPFAASDQRLRNFISITKKSKNTR